MDLTPTEEKGMGLGGIGGRVKMIKNNAQNSQVVITKAFLKRIDGLMANNLSIPPPARD